MLGLFFHGPHARFHAVLELPKDTTQKPRHRGPEIFEMVNSQLPEARTRCVRVAGTLDRYPTRADKWVLNHLSFRVERRVCECASTNISPVGRDLSPDQTLVAEAFFRFLMKGDRPLFPLFQPADLTTTAPNRHVRPVLQRNRYS